MVGFGTTNTIKKIEKISKKGLTNAFQCAIINTSKTGSSLKNRKELIIMANSQKLTKAQKYGMLKDLAEVKANPVLVEFIDHELELLAKKNSSEKKPTAQQTANEGIKSAIYEGMEVGKRYTITDLIKEIPECADLTNQRVSSLVRQMMNANLVERVEDKRKAYFVKIG
jgi:predicted transcriptional regulator